MYTLSWFCHVKEQTTPIQCPCNSWSCLLFPVSAMKLFLFDDKFLNGIFGGVRLLLQTDCRRRNSYQQDPPHLLGIAERFSCTVMKQLEQIVHDLSGTVGNGRGSFGLCWEGGSESCLSSGCCWSMRV